MESQLDQGINFIHVGTLVPDVSTYLIIGQLNITDVISQVDKLVTLEKSARDMISKIPDSYTMEAVYLNKTLRLMELKLQDIEGKIDEVKFIFNKTAEESRGKRSIAGAVALIGSGASFIANSFLVNSLQSQLSSFSTAIKELISFSILGAREIQENKERIAKLEKHLNRLSIHTYLKMNQFQDQLNTNRFISDSILHINLGFLQLSDLEDNIRNILTIVDGALNNKISTTMISPKQAREELNKIQISGYEPVINTLEEFYSLTSYATIDEENLLNVYISIPLINNANKYQLYQYVDAPLTMDGMQVRLAPTKDLLAIGSKDNLYTELREADLTSCLTVGRLKLCPHIRLFRKSGQTDNCLFNLFIGQFDKAKCDGEIQKVSEVEINIINENKIAITAQNDNFNGILECPSNSSTGILRRTIPAPRGISLVQVDDGCSYQISSYYLFPNKKNILKFNSHVHIRMSNNNIEDLIKIRHPTLVKEALENQDTLQIQDINNEDKLLKYINSTQLIRIQEEISGEDYVSYSALVISIIIVIIISMGLGYWYIRNISTRCFSPSSEPATRGVEARDDIFDEPEEIVQQRDIG